MVESTPRAALQNLSSIKYPNPFNAEIKISYELSCTGQVSLAEYNALDHMVKQLVH
ncbi:hypothetical protein JXO59_11775 [candidate division KSB1 bacterium]|nr:hypothetical protein [candidate division KSB1 bacterium]